MKNTYSIDLAEFSLEKFKQQLRSRELIPSRQILKDDLDSRFSILERSGISNLKELISTLKNKGRMRELAENTGLDPDYLNLLRREAASYQANPVPLKSLPGIAPAYITLLSQHGIKNTKHLFGRAQTSLLREQLAADTGVPKRVLDELVCLSDLCRAYGVGPVFARLIYKLGIKTISDFVQVSPEKFVEIYEEQTGKNADFSADEIRFSLDLAKELEISVDLS